MRMALITAVDGADWIAQYQMLQNRGASTDSDRPTPTSPVLGQDNFWIRVVQNLSMNLNRCLNSVVT